jgi:hypothetical protein
VGNEKHRSGAVHRAYYVPLNNPARDGADHRQVITAKARQKVVKDECIVRRMK